SLSQSELESEDGDEEGGEEEEGGLDDGGADGGDRERDDRAGGLQLWHDEASFLRSMEGGRLALVAVTAPWCDERDNASHVPAMASLAAAWLDESFRLPSGLDAELRDLPRPAIGAMDDAVARNLEGFDPVARYPALKFVFAHPGASEPEQSDDDDGDDDDDDDDDDESESADDEEGGGAVRVELWDHVGPRESAKDLYDGVLMYWYRAVVASAGGGGGGAAASARPPVFSVGSSRELRAFLRGHGDRLLRPSHAMRRHRSEAEEEAFRYYMGRTELGGVFHDYEVWDDDDDDTSEGECDPAGEEDGGGPADDAGCDEAGERSQEIDPYVILVQCRSSADYGTVDPEGAQLTEEEMARRQAKDDFDELAEEMFHRRDVAFFAIDAARGDGEDGDGGCDDLFGELPGGAVADGAVAFLRARRRVAYSLPDAGGASDPPPGANERGGGARSRRSRRRLVHEVATDWDAARRPRAVFVPSAAAKPSADRTKLRGIDAAKDPAIPAEHVRSDLVASTIHHASPTVLWFDRARTAQLAFPWWRKVHAVLFVDAALAHKKKSQPSTGRAASEGAGRPSWLNRSEETERLFADQRRAVQLFYAAALRHRVERPDDHVVFLIVPSSEVGIMTAFGESNERAAYK
ncbi:hypothetical protein ACHAWF_013335, partial [Thalassiosira exigua]